jgi:hypothetical protein
LYGLAWLRLPEGVRGFLGTFRIFFSGSVSMIALCGCSCRACALVNTYFFFPLRS